METDVLQPPCDVDAELSFCGSVLLKPDSYDDVPFALTPADFYDPACAILFEHILRLRNAGKPVDLRTLAASLKNDKRPSGDAWTEMGGSPFMATVSKSVPYAAHMNYYAEIVADKSMLRQVVSAGEGMIRDARESGDSGRDVAARAEERIHAVADRQSLGDQTASIDTVLAEVIDNIERRKTDGVAVGLPTGYFELDGLLGGLRPGEATILAGRTSMGKTALALNVAEYVAVEEQVPTLVVSLEMSQQEVGERLAVSRARVDSFKVKRGRYGQDEMRRILAANEAISRSPLFVNDAPNLCVAEIATVARRLKRKRDLGLLVIDYLQLIRPDNPKEPRHEQVGAVSRRIKALARELHIPVLCLAQLNRQAELGADAPPRLSHLRESGAIEQDADVVLFIHRPGYYSPNRPAPGTGEAAEVIVAKQRNGPTGSAGVLWFGSYVRFDNASHCRIEAEAFGR